MATTTAPVKRGTTVRGTSVFLKFIMATTGLVFIGYLLLHMYGNLMVFGGPETFDSYAHHLRTFGEPMLPYGGLLWIVRIVLILSIIGHLYSAITLWSRANNARSTKYAVRKLGAASLGSRTMRWGGVAILIFVIWHLIHFTIVKPAINAAVSAGEIQASPYAMVVASFQLWWMTVIYILAMLAVGLHLSHGAFSVFQTLGWTQTARSYVRAKAIGHSIATLIVVGFILPPVAILLGLVK